MKKIIASALLLIAMGTQLFAQNNEAKITNQSSKIIVMINTASWCPACQANGQRIEKDVVSSFMNNPNYQIVVNDLSTDETKAKSNSKCKKAGIAKIAKANTATGVIYFINAKTKELVSQISVTKPNETIIEEFKISAKKV